MLNYFGNTNLVPNGYVYTSHTGSKYVFLEGLWFNNSSMNLIDPSTYGNMYISAQKQIVEHNTKNKLKIGQTYLREGHEHVYIGEGNYTQNGQIVTEADNPALSNLVLGSTDNIVIPDKFKLDGGDYVYSTDKGWWGKQGNATGRITDKTLLSDLNADAIERIQHYNKTDPYPVGTTVDYNGEQAVWNGDEWRVGSKGVLPSGVVSKIDDFVEAEKSKETNTDPEPSTSEPQPEAQPAPTSQPSAGVPNGFVYTSGKGKQYYKKGGEWYISGTKNKVNSSAARPLEQAAAKKIAELNASSDLKIGETTWTSSKGKQYTYVGDDRFIGADGKMIPKGMAEKVKNDLAAKKDDHKEENSEIKDKVDADIDDTSTATPEDRKEEEKVDQEQAVDDHDAKEDDQAEGEDKIKGLADKIKSQPTNIARKITVLLTRADKLSLMAADILLSGQADKVKQILQTLNKRDE